MKKLLATLALAAAFTGVGHASAAAPFAVSNSAPVVGETVTFTADPCGRCAYKWTVTTVNAAHKTITYLTDVHQSITWTFTDGTVYTFLLRETAGNGTNSVLASGQLSIRATP